MCVKRYIRGIFLDGTSDKEGTISCPNSSGGFPFIKTHANNVNKAGSVLLFVRKGRKFYSFVCESVAAQALDVASGINVGLDSICSISDNRC